MFGVMSYNTLLEVINFQYNFNSKIQYWEDFLSQLTFIENLEKYKSLFHSISLSNHLAHLIEDWSAAEVHFNISCIALSPTPSPTPDPSILHAWEKMGMWSVKINPHKYWWDKKMCTNSGVRFSGGLHCQHLGEHVNTVYNAQITSQAH